MDVNVNCNKCSQDFVIKPLGQRIIHEQYGEIKRQFFSCPHCGAEYDFGYVDTRVQALVDENSMLLKSTDRGARKLYNHNMQKIKKLSGKLGQVWEKYHRPKAADIG